MEGMLDRARVATHGIAAVIAERRMHRAGEAMEEMDHREAVYTDLGALAIHGKRTFSPTASGEPAMPRARAERRFNKRTSKLARERDVRETYATREQRTFGPTPERSEKARKDAVKHIKHQARAGMILAGEADDAILDVHAQRLPLGKEWVHKTTATSKEASGQLKKAVERPRFDAWRRRQQRAIDRIQGNQASNQHHLELRQEARDRLQKDRELRAARKAAEAARRAAEQSQQKPNS